MGHNVIHGFHYSSKQLNKNVSHPCSAICFPIILCTVSVTRGLTLFQEEQGNKHLRPSRGFLVHYSLWAMLNRSTSQRFSDGKNTLHVSSSHSVIPALCQCSAGVLKHKTQKPASKADVGICETKRGTLPSPCCPGAKRLGEP